MVTRSSYRAGPPSARHVWFGDTPEWTFTGSGRGWMIEVEVPDDVAESWRYMADGEWLQTYNPLAEAVNSYPRRAYPWPPT
ncbi:hypothetical protein GCM10023350_48780 [Nocardioides endophyticus]|uniref:DUF402 domain-containing protein n=1 Tax=Nocardioides endophyticus TaxID=1353775 RepID=A0ABP8ZIQ7_9ACTN